MLAIEKIRRPAAIHTTDQIVSMALAPRLDGWQSHQTISSARQCRAVIGLAPQDEKWLAGGKTMSASGMARRKTRAKRQEALDVVGVRSVIRRWR